MAPVYAAPQQVEQAAPGAVPSCVSGHPQQGTQQGTRQPLGNPVDNSSTRNAPRPGTRAASDGAAEGVPGSGAGTVADAAMGPGADAAARVLADAAEVLEQARAMTRARAPRRKAARQMLRDERRASQYARRRSLQELAELVDGHVAAFPFCGRVPTSCDGVQLRLAQTAEGPRAGFGGLTTCGSVVCPVCGPKVAARRAEDIGLVLAWARSTGHTIGMVTLTMRHQHGDALADEWDAATKGWARVTGGAGWKSESRDAYARRLAAWQAAGQLADKGQGRAPRGWRTGTAPQRRIGDAERAGLVGWLRAVEVTHGGHGWHLHVHAVIVLGPRRGETKADREARARALGENMHRRWAQGVAALGFESWRDHGGLDVKVSAGAEQALARYLAKSADSEAHVRNSVAAPAKGLAREATMGHLKQARSAKGRTPGQIADDAVAELRADPVAAAYVDFVGGRPLTRGRDAVRDRLMVPGSSVALWQEYVAAARGRQQITWSEGLRDLAGLARELTDQEAAEEPTEQDGTEGVPVLDLPTRSWWRVQPRAVELLQATEAGGPEGARAWLDARGIEWHDPDPDRRTFVSQWARGDAAQELDPYAPAREEPPATVPEELPEPAPLVLSSAMRRPVPAGSPWAGGSAGSAAPAMPAQDPLAGWGDLSWVALMDHETKEEQA